MRTEWERKFYPAVLTIFTDLDYYKGVSLVKQKIYVENGSYPGGINIDQVKEDIQGNTRRILSKFSNSLIVPDDLITFVDMKEDANVIVFIENDSYGDEEKATVVPLSIFEFKVF